MPSDIISRTYGTVSTDKQKEMTGLEFVQGLADGTLPLNTIAKTLGTESLLLGMVQWRVAPRWYAFALLIPAAVTLRRLHKRTFVRRRGWIRRLRSSLRCRACCQASP